MKRLESTGDEFPAGAGRLLNWLSDSHWEMADLMDVLSGHSVPGSYAGIEPYEWVLDILIENGNPPYQREELARRLAVLLDELPAVVAGQAQPDKVVFNALSLCASLHQPAELASVLRRVCDGGLIEGKWEGLSLRGRLRAAIAGNQDNWDWQDTWISMAKGQADDALPGNPFQGWTPFC